MTSRTVLQLFDQYQRSRLSFVQMVAELACKPQNIELLDSCQVLDLLRPLLSDVCPQIQQCATIAVGRLVHNSSVLAQKLITDNVIPLLVSNLQSRSKYYKNSLLFVLRSICKHDANMADFVIASGGLQAFIACLEDFETTVKESAAWAIGYIARHNKKLAQICVEAGSIPLLILCLQESDLTLKQIATSALSDISKHSLELAQAVADAGAVPHLARNLNNLDEKLKKQVLYGLSSLCKHSVELAEIAVEAEIFPSVLVHLSHTCPMVRRNAACLVRDIAKHNLELTQMVVNNGGIGALAEVLVQFQDETRIPVITALGYIAGHSEQLALTVLECKVLDGLQSIMQDCQDDTVLCVTAWTLGQIGKHSPEHSQNIASRNLFSRLTELMEDPKSSEDLSNKCKVALKQCLQKCMILSALEPLLYDAPPSILKYVLAQFSKVLPHDPKARRLFVTSGALKRIQEIDATPGTALFEYVNIVNACFPEEIVRYYSPGYPETLLEKVEQYSPQLMSLMRETNLTDNDVQTTLSDTQDNLLTT